MSHSHRSFDESVKANVATMGPMSKKVQAKSPGALSVLGMPRIHLPLLFIPLTYYRPGTKHASQPLSAKIYTLFFL